MRVKILELNWILKTWIILEQMQMFWGKVSILKLFVISYEFRRRLEVWSVCTAHSNDILNVVFHGCCTMIFSSYATWSDCLFNRLLHSYCLVQNVFSFMESAFIVFLWWTGHSVRCKCFPLLLCQIGKKVNASVRWIFPRQGCLSSLINSTTGS